MTVGAAVHATGHGQVVERAETGEAAVAADLVDVAVKNHLVFALREETPMRCRRSLETKTTETNSITFPL